MQRGASNHKRSCDRAACVCSHRRPAASLTVGLLEGDVGRSRAGPGREFGAACGDAMHGALNVFCGSCPDGHELASTKWPYELSPHHCPGQRGAESGQSLLGGIRLRTLESSFMRLTAPVGPMTHRCPRGVTTVSPAQTRNRVLTALRSMPSSATPSA